MAKRRVATKSAQKAPVCQVKALPKGKAALSLLLRSTEKVLDFLESALQGQRTRLAELRRVFREPQRIVAQRPFLQEIAKANRRRFAEGAPSLTDLAPYLDGDEMATILERRRVAQARLAANSPGNPLSTPKLKACIGALAEVVAADEAVIDLIREFRDRIVAAMDKRRPDSADKETDKRCQSPVRVPQNLAVVRLAKHLAAATQDGTSQHDAALSFTNGNERQADNLLRQLRRFRHLKRRRRR